MGGGRREGGGGTGGPSCTECGSDNVETVSQQRLSVTSLYIIKG